MYVCTRWSLLDRTMKCACEGNFVRSRVVERKRASHTKCRQKSEQNRSTNRRKSFLGRFWAFKAVAQTRRDPLGTGPGRSRASRERSWDGQGAPRELGTRPKVVPSRTQNAPGLLRSSVRACLERRTLSNTIAERFFHVSGSSRTSSDVRKT